MSVYPRATYVVMRREMDAITKFYEKRSTAHRRKLYRVTETPQPGLCFVFHGMCLPGCEHFLIDFMTEAGAELCDNCNVVLRIGARLPQNYLTRNSRLKGLWGPMERSSNLSFQLTRGKSFWMQILITEECFLISVNGYHFAPYIHRMPYKWLEAVDVRGDVTDIAVDSFFVSEYPVRLTHSLPVVIPLQFEQNVATVAPDVTPDPRAEWRVLSSLMMMSSPGYVFQPSLALPFYGTLPEKEHLTEGRALRIEGRMRLMPQSFSFALQIGQEIWPQPTVSFYFSQCFLRGKRDKVGNAIVTRSAYVKGEWVNTHVSRLSTSLRPGSAFVILIACRKQYYELFVNNKSLFQFKYQMRPDRVDIVNIRGDIKLWEVVIETSNPHSKPLDSVLLILSPTARPLCRQLAHGTRLRDVEEN